MEAGLIGDDDMQRRGIGAGDRLEKDRVDVLIDGRGEQQFAGMRPVHFQGFVEVAPLVTGGVGGVNAHAPPAPDPADHRQQTIAVLIQHPQAHRLGGRRAHHRVQSSGQLNPQSSALNALALAGSFFA